MRQGETKVNSRRRKVATRTSFFVVLATVLVIFVWAFLFLTGRSDASHAVEDTRRKDASSGKEEHALDPGRALALAAAGRALNSLEELHAGFEARLRVLEAARLRGDFGDFASGRLLRAWAPWAGDFVADLHRVALSYDMKLRPLDQRQKTPVHAAYALVEEACRAVGRAWAAGRGVEGLPALSASREGIERARSWLIEVGR